VTIAAGNPTKKLIGYSRGQIRIHSRAGLEDAPRECYGMQSRGGALQFAL